MKLFTFPPSDGEPAGSPFAIKALLFLQASGQPYSVEYLNDPRKMPKGKLPVLQVADRMIPDSEQIREYLETTFGCDFDQGLSDEQKGVSRAIIRMADEHIYFINYASRWQEDAHWDVTKQHGFDDIPKLIRGFASNAIRKGAIKQLMGQGMGRHSPAERLIRFKQDINAIAAILGDKPFLFGEAPTAADMSIVPALRFVAAFSKKNDLGDALAAIPPLVSYMDRGKQVMYPK